MPDSVIDAATLEAYRQTEYRVLGSMPATLLVGVKCMELAALHGHYKTDCSAFITACNPRGERVADAINARQQQALCVEISHLGREAVPGIGCHPTGTWPGEASYLVPGLTRVGAQELGRKFQQNAIIWAGSDVVPQLLLLR